MAKIRIDPQNPDLQTLRRLVLQRLQTDTDWKQIGGVDFWLERHVELSPPHANDRRMFEHAMLNVFWDLVVAGIVVPGTDQGQPNFPWFRVSEYGWRVVAVGEYEPHDRDGYVRLLKTRVSSPDVTVLAYLDESLETFHRGNNVASMVMLGVAAERVFNLLCESLTDALANSREQAKFRALLERFAMKPKVDWVHQKFQALQSARMLGFPENAPMMVTAVYDLIRSQRNDLGHPRDLPPRMSPGEAHANLLIFPRYYEAAENVRTFLGSNRV